MAIIFLMAPNISKPVDFNLHAKCFYTVNDIIFDNPAGVTLTHSYYRLYLLWNFWKEILIMKLPQGVDGFYSPDVKKPLFSKMVL